MSQTHDKEIEEMTEIYGSQRRRGVDYDCSCRIKNSGTKIRLDVHICHAHWGYMKGKTLSAVDKWMRNQSE